MRKELKHVLENQGADNWCWAAVAEAVAALYARPANPSSWTQCRIAHAQLSVACCSNPVPTDCDLKWPLDQALKEVGHLAKWRERTLSMADISAEIQADRPIGVRIQWDADDENSGHFVLITGYDEDAGTVYIEDSDPNNGDGERDLAELHSGRYVTTGKWTHTYWTRQGG